MSYDLFIVTKDFTVYERILQDHSSLQGLYRLSQMMEAMGIELNEHQQFAAKESSSDTWYTRKRGMFYQFSRYSLYDTTKDGVLGMKYGNFNNKDSVIKYMLDAENNGYFAWMYSPVMVDNINGDQAKWDSLVHNWVLLDEKEFYTTK